MSDNTDQPKTFDIDSVSKEACLLVVRLTENLRENQMSALKSALSTFSVENPGIPPFIILPPGMTIEAYVKENPECV